MIPAKDASHKNTAPFDAAPEQIRFYHKACDNKPYREQLRILVIEDQIFSQKLLCEILSRDARSRHSMLPQIDVAQGVQEGWKTYLENAPDLTFVDIGLVDGNGHTLARAMKELDPTSCVVIVTANDYHEEVAIAVENGVDGFIAKPYNKRQILNFVQQYTDRLKSRADNSHASTGHSH